VARIHFRGHVNRNLRGLLASAPLPQGASLVDETGKPVGDVRSSVISPRLGPIAIAMVRREVPEGASITALTPTGAVTVQVTTLPFPIAD
jgi:glycine cleavage system aminomethyltransferase T